MHQDRKGLKLLLKVFYLLKIGLVVSKLQISYTSCLRRFCIRQFYTDWCCRWVDNCGSIQIDPVSWDKSQKGSQIAIDSIENIEAKLHISKLCNWHFFHLQSSNSIKFKDLEALLYVLHLVTGFGREKMYGKNKIHVSHSNFTVLFWRVQP